MDRSLPVHGRVGLARRGVQVSMLCAMAAIALLHRGCYLRQAGGRTDPEARPAPLFTDVANAAGLDYRWSIPGPRPLNILQTIGNGCAFLDFDNDGNLDILLVGPKLALYKGDGHGRFTDVTHETGLDKLHGHFLGCAVGDYDNDGYDDIYITAYRGGVLLHNEPVTPSRRSDQWRTENSPPKGGANPVRPATVPHSGGQGVNTRKFRDVTAEAGLKPQPWGTSAGFVEASPGSGRLDLYICNYAVFGPTTVPQLCVENGLKTSCGPRHYTPIHGVFYRNLGHGRFQEWTKQAGLDKVSGRALGVAFANFGQGEPPAIAIANDEMPGDLLVPVRRGASYAFANRATMSGTAFDRDGNIHGGMGLDWGDYDNDGRFDLFVATFQGESKSLYHNEGAVSFVDTAISAGIGAPSAPFVAFGCKFIDYDNDGWLDLVVANGHVQDNIHLISTASSYRQTCQLFHSHGGSPTTFDDASQLAGPPFAVPVVGRGLAVGDFDNDGREDVLIVDAEGSPLLLHNGCRTGGHWLGVRLEGTRSNRDGYGAVVAAQVGARVIVRQCQSAGSYMSASDRRVHIGVGAAGTIDKLTVAWPSGATTTLTDVRCDRYIDIREGDRAPSR